MARTAKVQSTEGETSQEKIQKLYLGDQPRTEFEVKQTEPQVAPPNGNGAGANTSTRPSSSSYNPYVQTGQGQTRIIFGAEYKRRMPSGFETKRIITLTYEHSLQALPNGQEELKKSAKDILGKEVSDYSQLTDAEREQVTVVLLDRIVKTPQQIASAVMGTPAWNELCGYVLSTFYTPAIDYTQLASAVIDDDGRLLGHPVDEADKEVDNFLDTADILYFFRRFQGKSDATTAS